MKKSKNPFKKIYPILLFLATVVMGIGYAASNVSLDVSGKISAIKPSGVFISQVVYKSSVNADTNNSKIISGVKTVLGSEVHLSSSDSASSITYTVKVHNSTSDKYVFTGVNVDNNFYDNSNIVYSTSISKGKIISAGGNLTFTITFSYASGFTPSEETNSLESYLNFKFEKCYSVTYENVSGTYVNYALAGKTFKVTFTSTDPLEIKMGGSTLATSKYTFSNKVLTIPNVTGNLHIRKKLPYTIKNLVLNGSFENNLNNWTIVGSSTSWHKTTIFHFGSYAYYRDSSEASNNYLRQQISFINGHKYYYFAHAICTSKQDFYADIFLKGGTIKFTAIPEHYTKGGVIYTSDFTGTNPIHINFAKTTDSVIVDGIGMIDLTAAFGAGNEPSKSWCDSNISYFDGSKVVYK